MSDTDSPDTPIDAATVRRIARLARIAVPESAVPNLQKELSSMLAFAARLSDLDVTGVEPLTSVVPMALKMRMDLVTDGEIADLIMQNAPISEDHYFMVPKVVE
jgi:aspartyl-tRNA(Asn)/glutamyl-tRNA(Gln) amidotransferase subunit C